MNTSRNVYLMACLLSLTTACGQDNQSGQSVVLVDDVGETGEGAASGPNVPVAEETTPTSPGDIDSTTNTSDEAPTSSLESDDVNTEQDGLGEGPLRFASLDDGGEVVAFVDIDRYLGRWYEIATTPSFQQASCTDTQAVYSLNPEGYVDVVNRCTVRNGGARQQEVRGRAEVVDEDTQAKLTVSFFGQTGPYWVVALDGTDTDVAYQWAVVSGPGSQFMWVLSRQPSMDAVAKDQLYDYLEERGFPVDRLIETEQSSVQN